MPLLFIFIGIIFYIYCEISLLVSVGSYLGIFPTILLLIGISALGLWLVKLRGAYTLFSVRQQLARGELPTDSVINAVLFILAGVLLIIPGFLSDILAILLMLPPSRALVKLWGLRFLQSKVRFTTFTDFTGFQKTQRNQEEGVFDAEFTRQQDEDKWVK